MMRPAKFQLSRQDWLVLILLSILWGSSFFLGKYALREISPWAIVFGRLAIAAFALNLIGIALRKFPRFDRRLWLEFLFLGFLNNAVPFSLIFWGQQYIASGLASIINATTPLFSAIFVHLFHAGEPLNLRRLVGVVAGLCGVAILIGPNAFAGFGDNLAGEIAIIGAAISYALSAIYARRFKELPPLMPAIGQINSAALLVLPVWLLLENPFSAPLIPSELVLAAILSLGLLSTALAYILYFRLISRAGATNATLVTFLVPVSALLLGTLFLKEELALSQYAGMALIFLGLAIIDGRLFGKKALQSTFPHSKIAGKGGTHE